ncbi:MAG: zf-HC2 domain-containing protein [Clostridia bacterium]|nr:zf-HC2 domain-containing protein [Clostridia bacterium]
MSEIPCEVIRDLMPSCADGIANPETEKLVNEHIASCAECEKAYNAMREGEEEPALIAEDGREGGAKEIDFLKKNRKRNGRIALFSVLGAVLLLLAAAAVKLFVVGSYSNDEDPACVVETDGRIVRVREIVNSDGAKRIKKIVFSEENGIVTIKLRTVLASFLTKDAASAEFEAKEDVVKVVFNNRVIWKKSADGGYSEALINDVKNDWADYLGMTEMERVFMNRTPGYIFRYFENPEEAYEYLGHEPMNPFETDESFAKKNFCGTDSTGPYPELGKLYRAEVTAIGDENGNISYTDLTMGYALSGGVRLMYSFEPSGRWLEGAEASPDSDEVEYRVSVYGEDPEGIDPGSTVTHVLLLTVRSSSADGWYSKEITFDCDGGSYTARLICANEASLNTAAEKVIDVLTAALAEH